jgi:hypothetical protein
MYTDAGASRFESKPSRTATPRPVSKASLCATLKASLFLPSARLGSTVVVNPRTNIA